jgi:hypothetical protein
VHDAALAEAVASSAEARFSAESPEHKSRPKLFLAAAMPM